MSRHIPLYVCVLRGVRALRALRCRRLAPALRALPHLLASMSRTTNSYATKLRSVEPPARLQGDPLSFTKYYQFLGKVARFLLVDFSIVKSRVVMNRRPLKLPVSLYRFRKPKSKIA